jgi:Xaa-Pro aminopeptidase
MDVHDVGRIETPLAPRMVLTVEPGVYLSEERLGVRIEDDVLVTADGHEVLSSGAPKLPEEIEALMQEPATIP